MARQRKARQEKPLTLEEAIELLRDAEKLLHEPVKAGGEPYLIPRVEHSDILTPKAKLFAEIMRIMKMGMEKYYRRFPEREHDQRAIEALFWSAAGMRIVLMKIDEYEIREKEDVYQS